MGPTPPESKTPDAPPDRTSRRRRGAAGVPEPSQTAAAREAAKSAAARAAEEAAERARARAELQAKQAASLKARQEEEARAKAKAEAELEAMRVARAQAQAFRQQKLEEDARRDELLRAAAAQAKRKQKEKEAQLESARAAQAASEAQARAARLHQQRSRLMYVLNCTQRGGGGGVADRGTMHRYEEQKAAEEAKYYATLQEKHKAMAQDATSPGGSSRASLRDGIGSSQSMRAAELQRRLQVSRQQQQREQWAAKQAELRKTMGEAKCVAIRAPSCSS